jgi:hypothetical protein
MAGSFVKGGLWRAIEIVFATRHCGSNELQVPRELFCYNTGEKFSVISTLKNAEFKTFLSQCSNIDTTGATTICYQIYWHDFF